MSFPYKLSKYSSLKDLLLPVNEMETLPEEVDDWLQYFLQANQEARAGISIQPF